MGLERIEALRPRLAVRVEPLVELDESFRLQLIHTSLGDGFGSHESSGAEHFQMFGHCWLAEGKCFHQLSYRLLPNEESRQDRPTVRFSEYCKNIHLHNMPDRQYACQGILVGVRRSPASLGIGPAAASHGQYDRTMPRPSMADSVQATRVVLCGSMSAISQIEELANSFRSLGYDVVTPARDERDERWATLSPDEQVSAKRGFIDSYLDEIRAADIVVLANFTQNGISGYVGANTLMEAAFARAFDIPLFLYEEPGPQPAQLELLSVRTGCLDGNPLNLPPSTKTPTRSA